MKSCLVCERIRMIQEGTNPYFVAELETGYVVMGDHQYFRGYTLFLAKEHIKELHFLDSKTKQQYLLEMSMVGEAVYKAFEPNKLNYELLGNGEPHLHCHIFPRRLDEANPAAPVWLTDRNVMYSETVKPNPEELQLYKQTLYGELVKIQPNIIRAGDCV